MDGRKDRLILVIDAASYCHMRIQCVYTIQYLYTDVGEERDNLWLTRRAREKMSVFVSPLAMDARREIALPYLHENHISHDKVDLHVNGDHSFGLSFPQSLSPLFSFRDARMYPRDMLWPLYSLL